MGEGRELTKVRNVQLPAVHIYSQCGARGAVFRDIVICPSNQLALLVDQFAPTRPTCRSTWPRVNKERVL